MPTVFELLGFILLVIEILIGMVGNGFIAIINFIDWFGSRKLSPADMILSCLALFRFAYHTVGIQTAILTLFFKNAVQTNIYITLGASLLFLNTANLWFGTLLSVLYCVKIANFSHPLFLKMKRRFPGLVPWLLLGTVVFSAIITTIGAIIGRKAIYECNIIESLLSNNTDSGVKRPDSCKYYLLLYIVPAFFPFVIFFSSSTILLTSLWRHKKLLQNTARDISTEVHLNAIKTLASFLILYVCSFCVNKMTISFTWNGIANTGVQLLFANVALAYSSGHAIILIFMNPKLKQASVKVLHQLKC